MIVGELMTRDPLTVGADATAKSALRLLHENVVTTLPVVDADGLLVGVVSDIDLLRRLLSPDPPGTREPASRAPAAPAARSPRRDRVRLLSVSDATIAADARRHPDRRITCNLPYRLLCLLDDPNSPLTERSQLWIPRTGSLREPIGHWGTPRAIGARSDPQWVPLPERDRWRRGGSGERLVCE